MRVIALKTLRDFWDTHPDAREPIQTWLEEVTAAQWRQPADIKAQFASASILKGRRVVFNIKGNDVRLVASVAYRFGALYVKFIGTHAQYDRIDADSVELSP